MKQVFFTGRVGKDATLEFSKTSNNPYARFSVGVYDGKDKDGKPQTLWIACTIFGKTAEAQYQRILKGVSVTVAGDPKVRAYQKQDGTTAAELSCAVALVDVHAPAQQQNTQTPNAEHAAQDMASEISAAFS